MTNATHIVSRDGIARYIGTESQCWQWLHDATPASIDYATKYGGWRLEELKEPLTPHQQATWNSHAAKLSAD